MPVIGIFNTNLNTQEINKRVELPPENKFFNTLPYDFFGDYSNPEFWVHSKNDEIVYEKPNDISDWEYVESYIGKGIKSFVEYTDKYNRYLIDNNGYSKAKYVVEYLDFINGFENTEKFDGLDSKWTLLDISYYLEDWIVWNSNEVQEYDIALGRVITNDDIELSWTVETKEGLSGTTTITENKDGLLNFEMIEYKVFNEVIIKDLSGGNYKYKFVDQPISKEAKYNSVTKSWEYDIYKINRSILPYLKASIDVLFGKLMFIHNEFIKNFNLESKFIEFKNKFDEGIYRLLNLEFIFKYGFDEIEHDINQGYYEIESIKKSDYQIKHYELVENKWVLINNNSKQNREMSSYQSIKTEIAVLESATTSQGQIYTKFKPGLELYVPPNLIHGNTESSILMISLVTVGTIGLIIISGVVIFFIIKKKKNE